MAESKPVTATAVTTIRLNTDDLKAIKVIKDKYGATSTAGAIRLALRQVAHAVERHRGLTE